MPKYISCENLCRYLGFKYRRSFRDGAASLLKCRELYLLSFGFDTKLEKLVRLKQNVSQFMEALSFIG